eukprot:gene9587-1789_t
MLSTDGYFSISEYLDNTKDLLNLLLLNSQANLIQNNGTFWQSIYKIKIESISHRKKIHHKNYVSSIQKNFQKQKETLAGEKWKSVLQGYMKKLKIHKFQAYFYDNSFMNKPEKFWEKVIQELKTFDDFAFTRKMTKFQDSLLDLFFLSFFKFSNFWSVCCEQKFMKPTLKTEFSPISFHREKVLNFFKTIYKMTNLKLFWSNSRKTSPFHYLVWMNDFELLKEILEITKKEKIPKNFGFKEIFISKPVSLEITKFIINSFEVEPIKYEDATTLFLYASPEVLDQFIKFIYPTTIQGIVLHRFQKFHECRNHHKTISNLVSNFEVYFKNGLELPEYPGGNCIQHLCSEFALTSNVKTKFIPLLCKYDLLDSIEEIEHNPFYKYVTDYTTLKMFIDNGYDYSKIMSLDEIVMKNFDTSRKIYPTEFELKVDLFLSMGWDINSPFGISKEPITKFIQENWKKEKHKKFVNDTIEFLKKRGAK